MTGIYKKNTIEGTLFELIKLVKNNPNRDKAGAIVTFTGIVRKNQDTGKVSKLVIDSYEEMGENILHKIVSEEKKGDIIDIQISHFTGEFLPGEDLVHVVVMGAHRKICFETLQRVVERYKSETPLWKKEHLETGEEYWIEKNSKNNK